MASTLVFNSKWNITFCYPKTDHYQVTVTFLANIATCVQNFFGFLTLFIYQALTTLQRDLIFVFIYLLFSVSRLESN